MVFSSTIFLFGFLPAFLGIYYLLPARWRNGWIVLGSLAFYGWWKAAYLLLVLGIAAVTYVAGHLVRPDRSSEVQKYWGVRIGVTLNLLTLGWFKYAYFLGGSFNTFSMHALGEPASVISLPQIILPIGISFLVFQSISYIIDVARGDAPPAANVVDFLAFSVLFPQLIAGPILRYKDLAEQLRGRTHSVGTFVTGLHRFILGLAMKLLVADSVAPLADRLFALSHPTTAEAWLAALAYSIQLFFDFAGYSAMAIGLGLMIGFRFVENFNAPYTAKSITEFWQRWHISLSNWLRDYLYISLGGNRQGALKTYRNLVLTMVLGGLWHGANWTFVLWGIWHGGLMAIERALGVKTKGSVLPPVFAWALTMCFVMLGWVMFRAPDVAQAFAIYQGMLGINGVAMTGEMLILFRPSEGFMLVVGALIVAWPVMFKSARNAGTNSMRAAFLVNITHVALFALCFAVLIARSHSPFLYFQF